MDVIVVPGRANPQLAESLAKTLEAPVAQVDTRTFPDGEVYARILTRVADAHAVIVQSTNPNDNLVEAMLLAEAAREAGAKKITMVVPYFGYARQDRVFQDGEAISARTAARALGLDADHLVLLDPHKEDIAEFFPGTCTIVSAVPDLAETLGEAGATMILAPDKGARDRAARAANHLGVPFDHMEKTRLSATQVRMEAKELDVDGQIVAIVDDMIASGGTMITAARQLKEQGAKRVLAACTHGVFTNDAVPRLLAGGIDAVYASDSIEGEDAILVSAAHAIASGLQSA